MTLWLVFALMTAAAVFAVLWPLSRREGARGGSDVAVYRDQLEEVARDRAAGLIGEAEAEAARVEVSRRLLAAADTDTAVPGRPPADAAPSLWRRRAAAVAGLLLLPVGAAALYLALGSPQLPGEPLAARIQKDNSITSMVAQIETHLERNPGDARGYEVLAPVYLRLGRFADAVTARRKALALAGETADRQADLGEALAAAANGIVTADAKTAFERAVALDDKQFKARFFIGLAAEQDGDKPKASAIWRGMLEQAPADAPWGPMVREALVRVGGTPPAVSAAPGPSAADVAAASNMSEQDRGAMIRGMVAGLAERLKANGDDIEGWQRLLRAYMVLGERDKAAAAAADAKRALAANPDKLKQIEYVIKTLGIQG